MTTRKRKSPDRRRKVKEKSLLSRLLAGVAGFVARHPKPATGVAIFIVTFSFVAANALWYQPGHHPSPLLATRDAGDPNAIAGMPPRRAEPTDVTTFRIERAPSGNPAAPAEIRTVSAPAGQQPAGQPPTAVPPTRAEPAGEDIRSIITGDTGTPSVNTADERSLVAGIQRELARRGLYEGTDDGLMGPRTQAAILFFEESAGLPQRGAPTADLLAALQNEGRSGSQSAGGASAAPQSAPQVAPIPTPIPRQAPRASAQRSDMRGGEPSARVQPVSAPVRDRPSASAARPVVQQVSARSEDPVTAAIRSSERAPQTMPPAEIPRASARQPQQPREPAARQSAVRETASLRSATSGPTGAVQSTEMVLQIQKGLANIAYTDVEIDGVAGTQTKAAIRRFQRHYRLAETGEPNAEVLKKLKAIGAL